MPTYEYSCTECGEQLEVVQSIHDDSLTECPNCGGKLRKLFGNVGVVFKGSGFYKNDSRSAKSGKAGPGQPKEAAAKSSGDAGAKSSGTSESSGSESSSGSGAGSGGGNSGGSESTASPSKPAPAAKKDS